MNLYRSLLISTLLIILVVTTIQQQQACSEGGAFVQNLHSGIVELPYDDLNEGSINKNYFELIGAGTLSKDKRMAAAFSIVGFEGSGRQQYYALMLKQYSLQNENTRLSITMDFQYPNSNMLSIWTQIRLSYLIVSENLQRNGYSYVWVYTKEFQLKSSVQTGIVDEDLFNHPNDKNLCGYDGRYWHTDGCNNFEAVPIYHCYISGWKFNPVGYIGIRELAFSVQLINKKGEVSNDEKEQALDVIFNKGKEAGPRVKIDNFDGQMQKIKVVLVMSIIQVNTVTYPIGTFTITYSGMYFFNKTWSKGQQIIQRSTSNNLYHYMLPGMKYYIFGISRFVAQKGLPRPTSIMLSSQIQAQNLIKIQHNFRLPTKELVFSADFYYKRIDKICNTENGINVVQKSQISQVKFQNYPSNNTTLLIRSVTNGDMPQTDNQSAIEYLYYPTPQIEQSAWVTYTFSNIKMGGSYIFNLSINEIGNDGFADYTGYNFAVYVNEHQIYRTMIIGSPKNDKIDGIQKALNINNNSIAVKIYTKIYRQEQKNVNFRVNLLVKEVVKVFNPITQCCSSVCPAQTGINITSIPMHCIICDNQKGFFFNEKYNKCMCKKGFYFIQDMIFSKCLLCNAGLCDMCQPKQPKKCIQCIFGAELDPYYRTCNCLPEFIQVDNKCFLNTKIQNVCIKYGYCDLTFFTGIIFKPPAPKCIDGTFDNGEGSCSKCNPQCLTCSNITSCLSCDQNAHRVLRNNICVCKQGYFPFEHENKTRVCIKCAPQCQSCQFNPESCTQCDVQKFMQKVLAPKGLFTCQCMPGYHPDGLGNCIESNCNADRHCVTCEQKLCTSCTKSSNRILQLPEHICVCMDGFFENSRGECERCRSGCAKCNSTRNCQSCVILAFNNSDGTCSCPKGTFFNINIDTNVGFCRKCLAMCETCSDQRSCSTCPATYSLSQQKKCICQVGTFLDAKTSICVGCSQSCAECNSLKECTKCKPFFRLQEGSCVYNCRMGFYITQTACFKCSQGCARCENPLICQECSTGYILYQSQCHKECPQGTIKAAYKNDCIPCNSPCKTCLYHPSQCVSCQNGKGYLQQVGDQMKCLNECPLGMFPSNGVCELCDLNCLSCLGDKSNCIQCPYNQFLYKGKCHKQCPGVQYQNTCMNFCPNGYFRLEDKKCWPCSEKCLTCENDRQRCTSCRSGLVLKDNQCVQQCQQYEFQMGGKCIKCSTSCKACSGSALNCTSCFDNSELLNGKCQFKCLPNEYFSISSMECLECQQGCKKCLSSSQCIACQVNYTLADGKCENTCKYPCLNCLSKSQCLKCVIGFYLLEKEMECTPICPKGMRAQFGICKCGYGFYFNRTCHIVCPYQTFTDDFSKTCELCPIPNCASCSTKSICMSCQPNFTLSKDQSQCLRQQLEIDEEFRCPKGLIFMDNKCVKVCPQQNFDLLSTIKNGSMCVYGPYLSRSSSKQIDFQLLNPTQCPENQYIENGVCKLRCSIGYYLQSKTQQCKQCKENCISCSDQNACLLCQNGYFLIEKRCFSVKCEGTRKFFNGNCVNECPKGTYFDGEVCQLICPPNHYLSQGVCYLQCPDQNPYKVDFACFETCPKGYKAKGNECI